MMMKKKKKKKRKRRRNNLVGAEIKSIAWDLHDDLSLHTLSSPLLYKRALHL